MELEKVEKELREKWQEEFQDKSKIISLLNTFGNTVNKNCKPLEYLKEDDFVLFKLAKERLRYIQDFSEDNSENSIEHLSCFAFRALFFGTDDFKLENVDEHIKQFQVIIDCLSKIENKDQTNLLNSLIDKIDEKYKGNVLRLFKELFPKNFFIFIGLLILTNESNLFLEVLFRQIQNSFDVKYDFEYEDISKLPLEQAINDLCEIMINSEGKKNLIHLKLDEGHFQSYSFNNDEILEVLDSLNDEQKEKKDRIKSIIEKKKKKVTSKGKKQSLNKINEKLPSQNVEKGERSINEKNNNAIELNLNINNENSNINCERQIVIQKEDDKQEQKEDDKQDEDDKQEEDNKQKEDDKQEQKENDKQEQKEGDKQERQEDDKQKKQEDDEQSIMNEMKKIKNKLKNMEMSISNNEQKIKSLEESNQKLEKSNKKLEKSNQKLKKNIEQLKLASTNFSNKVDKLESQLDTIKMRDGIKAFIDYIFASLKLAAKIGYESKIYMIYITLDKKSKDYNQHLIKNIKFILYTVFKKLNIGNEFAHNVDLNSSIVDQMFELIKDNDNEEKLKETKIEFQKTNMDRVIKKLIQVRKENYNKPIEVRENEEKNVLSEVKDLDLILKIY